MIDGAKEELIEGLKMTLRHPTEVKSQTNWILKIDLMNADTHKKNSLNVKI